MYLRCVCAGRSYEMLLFFFFQAEDGIRDYKVTGVQTCALPISLPNRSDKSASVRRALYQRALISTAFPRLGVITQSPTRASIQVTGILAAPLRRDRKSVV